MTNHQTITLPQSEFAAYQQAVELGKNEVARLGAELRAAQERERVATDTYNGQQQSYRELETLYQASQERALKAEAELARVRTDRDLIRDALHQTEAALASERAARQSSDADAAQLRTAALAYVRATSYAERFQARAVLEVLATLERPGMLLVQELEAARALRAACQPLGSMARLNEACAAYDAVTKAGGG